MKISLSVIYGIERTRFSYENTKGLNVVNNMDRATILVLFRSAINALYVANFVKIP